MSGQWFEMLLALVVVLFPLLLAWAQLAFSARRNPNIDTGMEDAILGDDLYRKILDHFIRLYEAPHHETIASGKGRQVAASNIALRLIPHGAVAGHTTVALASHG